ncbi:MAG: hypothetical protein ABF260_02945 [Flavobacteriaceae bacterium]
MKIHHKTLEVGKVYSIDLSILFTADPGAIYRVEVSYKKEYSLYDCDEALLLICKQKLYFPV